MATRREFLKQGAMAAIASPLAAKTPVAQPAAVLDVRRLPDTVTVQTASPGLDRLLPRIRDGRWEDSGGVGVSVTPVDGAMRVQLSASVGIRRLRLRWNAPQDAARLILGDAWERGYGDLEWRGFVPDRVMPWYVAVADDRATHACGVRTGASAFCYWQVDPQGVTLWADVRSGSAAVELGARTLAVCDIVSRRGTPGESAFAAVHAFCRQMCPRPRMPSQPIYGSNDWYWAYGKNS